MKNLLIGLDFGSDSVRALLVSDEGEQIAADVQPYRRWSEGQFCSPSANQYRQHPLDYLEGMEAAIRAVLTPERAPLVRGIGLDTTGSTPCAVDKDCTPLALLPEFADNPNAMFILWKDHTALEEAARIDACAASSTVDYRCYEGGAYSSEWFWSKILHVLRVDARVRDAAFSWVEHCDWMAGELCGHTDPLTLPRGRCAAGHKAMWHQSWGGLPPESFLREVDPLLAGLRQRLYQETWTAERPVGRLSAKWAAKLGLSREVVISGAGIDCHFGAVGAQIQPGDLVKVCGTSTCDIVVAGEINRCIPGICGQVDGSVVPGLVGLEAGQAAFGDVYAWFMRLLSYGGGEVSLQQLEKEAAELAPGSTGVMALDWFNGRRSPDANPRLCGLLAGLQLGTTAPMLYRALVESTVFGARAIVERFIREEIPVRRIIATGGISRKSPFVMQLLADVLNMPVKITATEQTCALGAAMFAAVAASVHTSLTEAMERMGRGYERTCQPDVQNVPVYEKLYQQYQELGKSIEKMTTGLPG